MSSDETRPVVTTFTASDGVAIPYFSTGAGEALVLVHGGATDHRCFDPIVELLGERYTTVAYDRRGHGASEIGEQASLDREADDLVELATHVGGGAPVLVLAYSFGATIALHTVMTRSAPIRALVAYEPPFAVPGMIPEVDEINRLLADGGHEQALRLFVGTTFALSANAVEAMSKHPMWQVSLGMVSQLPAENALIMKRQLDEPDRPVPPIRVLIGADGGNPAWAAIASLAKEHLGADVATVPGLPHFAMGTEPVAFTERVVEHLDRHSSTRSASP